mgnify:FL=1
MPLYMDRHDIPGATAADVAHAHQQDLRIQDDFDCRAITYWFDEQRGMAFCLIEAPNEQAVRDMHDTAHGLVPHEIIEVQSNVVESFLGRIRDPEAVDGRGAEASPIDEPALRAVLAIDLRNACGRRFPADAHPLTRGVELRTSMLALLRRFGGGVVEWSGRGGLASFSDPVRAIDCGLEILRSSRDASPRTTARKFCASIGISVGQPLSRDAALFSDTMRSARRLSEIAPEGKILLSPSMKEFLEAGFSAEGQHDATACLTTEDERMLHLLMDVLESLWQQPDLSVADYSRALGLSKSQAYRKISALTGYGPAEFIREYRLRRAVELIEDRYGTISETAYEAGFSSLSYFSKCFKRRYGLLPSEYAGTVS